MHLSVGSLCSSPESRFPKWSLEPKPVSDARSVIPLVRFRRYTWFDRAQVRRCGTLGPPLPVPEVTRARASPEVGKGTALRTCINWDGGRGARAKVSPCAPPFHRGSLTDAGIACSSERPPSSSDVGLTRPWRVALFLFFPSARLSFASSCFRFDVCFPQFTK